MFHRPVRVWVLLRTPIVEVDMFVRGLVVRVLEENAEELVFDRRDRPFLGMEFGLASDGYSLTAAVDTENCAGLSRIGYLPD